ncbi:molecular chaperone DnaK [Brasilonema octagenarum UFV-E1]|uniref:Molecular chaperone DnaK n=1 Tax=Brasilonema sennae CENA114 TaxID=415709 RepID=A0A856MMT2_9CYAN|nr:Hsp70 family protein [Brasilonema sennae]QDL11400.1 molecular chaperone DnaK [Brasilonema sennae CENA114]QDL17742.1 molecular chaperone DnaK [Brasilonema octagenarum UFV-E1]QDL17791.1 molecular chaperone DnaK [Brasilonema octagenarum UFV-E1]
MTKNYAIGIDLGTSTSEICVYRNNESFPIPDPVTKMAIIPSIVAINKKGEILVGENARSWVDVSNRGSREIKRKMGTGETIKLLEKEYRPEEISALILRQLKENAEVALGIEIREVVLSVPANFPDAARQATLNAGELAGLKIIRLINEPTAAALAFGIKNIDVEEQLVVFDFGGGTLDITVLEMLAGVLDVKCSFGNPQLGGKDFDEAMIRLLHRKFKTENPEAEISQKAHGALKEAAEKAKKVLSTQQSYDVRIPYFAASHGEFLDLEVEVTQQEFEQAIAPLLQKARDCIHQALNAKNLHPSTINRVLLVGGTTYIPAVRQLVVQMFGKQGKALDVGADLAVGVGASIHAALAKGFIPQDSGVILTDVAPFGLGIEVVSYVGGQYMLTYEPLIQPNTTIPYSTLKTYTLLKPDQKRLKIRLYQDNTGRAKLPNEAIDTGIEAQITDIPPAVDGIPYAVQVEFSYDINGIAKLKATIPNINKSVELSYGSSAKRMANKDIADAASRLKELWKQNAKARQYEGLINKAERYMAGIPPQERSPLSDIVMELKKALMNDNIQEIQKAGDSLVDLLFDLENHME